MDALAVSAFTLQQLGFSPSFLESEVTESTAAEARRWGSEIFAQAHQELMKAMKPWVAATERRDALLASTKASAQAKAQAVEAVFPLEAVRREKFEIFLDARAAEECVRVWPELVKATPHPFYTKFALRAGQWRTRQLAKR